MLDNELSQTVSELGKKLSDVTITMHQAIARRVGLNATDHKYLTILVNEQPMTAGELAKCSGLTTGATTTMIDRFEKLGLVKREFVQNDRRKVFIVPDRAMIDKQLGPVYKRLKDKIFTLVMNLTDAEKKVIQTYMSDAIRVMEEITVELANDEP
ncbi:MarR family transcriptional regulator [Spirosoma horti]